MKIKTIKYEVFVGGELFHTFKSVEEAKQVARHQQKSCNCSVSIYKITTENIEF